MDGGQPRDLGRRRRSHLRRCPGPIESVWCARCSSPATRPPPSRCPDQDGATQKLSSYKGRKVLVYFYPKADTPGCTTQACGLRDIATDVGDTAIIGISPDKPAAQKKFDDQVRPRLPAAVRPRPRGGRGLRRVEGEVDVRQEVHGHRALGLPHRREGQDRAGVVQGQPEGHADQPGEGARLRDPAPAGRHPAAPSTVPLRRRGDHALVPGQWAESIWHFTGEEWFWPGHFPGRPHASWRAHVRSGGPARGGGRP